MTATKMTVGEMMETGEEANQRVTIGEGRAEGAGEGHHQAEGRQSLSFLSPCTE